MYEQPQWLKEFEQRHGTNYVIWNGWKLYANGARRENVTHEYPALHEPPTDPLARQKLKVAYAEGRLQEAVDALDACLEKAMKDDYAFRNQDQIIRQLDVLEARVQQKKKMLLKARRKLNRLDPSYQSPADRLEQARAAAALESEKNAFKTKLKKNYQL